ncbi:hypothetical protein ACLB2K_047026 [Fragaria x ananassa]
MSSSNPSSSQYGCHSVSSDTDTGYYNSRDDNHDIEEVPGETQIGNDLVTMEAEMPENKELEPEAPIEVVEEAPATTEISRGHFSKHDRELFTQLDGKKVHARHEKRALYVHCDADLKADSSFNGTSTLRRHIQKVCKKYAGRESIDDGQAVIAGDGEVEPEMELQKLWTNDRCVQAACEMIVIDELPFSHVENEGFKHFCLTFEMSSSNSSSSQYGCHSVSSDTDTGYYNSRDDNHDIEEVPGETPIGNDLVTMEAEMPENKELEPEAPIEVVEEAPATTEISRGVLKKRRRGYASTRPKPASKLTSMVWQHFSKHDRELFTQLDGKKVHARHEKRALYVHCDADLKADSSFNGTSTLRRHI